MATKVKESTSASLRKEGNKLYLSATEDFSPCVRRKRLEDASKYYTQAAQQALNKDELASARKNQLQTGPVVY